MHILLLSFLSGDGHGVIHLMRLSVIDSVVKVSHVADLKGVGGVTALSMNNDEPLLAAGYDNGVLIVWDLQVMYMYL